MSEVNVGGQQLLRNKISASLLNFRFFSKQHIHNQFCRVSLLNGFVKLQLKIAFVSTGNINMFVVSFYTIFPPTLKS